MKQSRNYLKMLLSGLCLVIFLFLAVASTDEKRGGSNGDTPTFIEEDPDTDEYTPTFIEEDPEIDFSSDVSEDEREEEVEFVSQTDDEEEFVSQTVDEDESEPSGSTVQEFPDTIAKYNR